MMPVEHDIARLQALCAIKSNLLRLKWLAAATRFELALARHDRTLKAGFKPDQSRDEYGRWTDGGGDTQAGQGQQTTELSAASAKVELLKKALTWTARRFIFEYCRGSINREFPGKFENATIGEIWEAAKSGDSRAKKCMKLLQQQRFRK